MGWNCLPPAGFLKWTAGARSRSASRRNAGAFHTQVGLAAGGAVGRGVHSPGGIGFPELRQGGPHTLLSNGSNGLRLVQVRLCAVDVDGVGGGIIGYAEVHRLADIPELDEIVVMDTVCLELHLLDVHGEGLGGGRDGELLGGGAGGATQGKAGEDADTHKECFPFSVHDDSPFGLL